MGARIDRRFTVSTPLETVWGFLSDFRSTEQWDPPTVRTVRLSGDGGVGTRYRNTSRLLGREVDIAYEVVAYDAPRLLELTGRAGSMSSVDSIRLRPGGAGTEVHYVADFTFSGPARLLTPVIGLGLQRLGRRAEAQLRRTLETL